MNGYVESALCFALGAVLGQALYWSWRTGRVKLRIRWELRHGLSRFRVVYRLPGGITLTWDQICAMGPCEAEWKVLDRLDKPTRDILEGNFCERSVQFVDPKGWPK